MRMFPAVLTLAALTAAGAHAQGSNPLISEDTTKISDHVWAIMGWPNIGIIVGTKATLVVDTGLGPHNGATIARVAAKLSAPNAKLYLTTTHFHPEHAAGDNGFPASTILLRNAVQQREMNLHGKEMLDMFASRNEQQKELLVDTRLRTPDILFEGREMRVDLGGGVSARLLWFGEAHTKGDELILAEPDQTLISGDVVQNKTMPNIFGDGGTPASWIGVVDQIAKLDVKHVLPDHSAPGDGSLVAAEKELLTDIRNQALALKKQGVSADAAGKRVTDALKAKHPDWPNTNAAAFVKSVYAE